MKPSADRIAAGEGFDLALGPVASLFGFLGSDEAGAAEAGDVGGVLFGV
jgi:hypothetical protein